MRTEIAKDEESLDVCFASMCIDTFIDKKKKIDQLIRCRSQKMLADSKVECDSMCSELYSVRF